MELSKEIIDGLTNIQNSNILSDETFLQLLGITIAYICENTNDVKSISTLHPSKLDQIKMAVANISCLFIEAAKHDYNEENLKTFLHSKYITEHRIEKICSIYMNSKENIQAQLESIGNSISHIVDVDWHLHYSIKLSTCQLVNMPIYNIQIITRRCSEVKYVSFVCTMQQLQELVYKLKDIIRHIEKISNV